MFQKIKAYNDLKTLFNIDQETYELYYFLKAHKGSYNNYDVNLIITPSTKASKKVFEELKPKFESAIVKRCVKDGNAYEFLYEKERIIIQDIGYILSLKHFDGMRFKSIVFME